tara:strand:+ start:22 stop:624 length:603 start_codon:yes stop_codon:yes gene_type:complete
MLNYNEKINTLDITNSAINAISIFTLAKTQKNNIGKRIDDNFVDLLFVCEETSTIISENKATKLVGKAKKANLELKLSEKGLLAFYSQLGKNDLTAVKVIGGNPQIFHDAYYEKETKVDSLRGIKALVKNDSPQKTIEEKIEAFIKSNITKKEDDEKITLLELAKKFSDISQKMHKENNSNIVDFLPTSEELENQVANAK